MKIQARIFDSNACSYQQNWKEEPKMLQFDVCCKAIDQNFNCGCDGYPILRLDLLL